ncbi:YncE family protein [Amycolatopsis taiwanensis]|uniref:Lipoprotein n=1 Tax=Amycolatopsis taiwanensis TaxID=342230 RepID=A0A9W6QZA1_9PSEU|nr:lipoprotein [Amycolatopsis taiwanensis]
MRRFAGSGVMLGCVLLVAACSSGQGGGGDELQVVDNPVAATAPVSPVPEASPAGTVLVPGNVTAMASDPANRVLAVAADNAVSLYRLDDLGATPVRVPVDGPVERLTVSQAERDLGSGLLASIPTRGEVVWIDLPGGQANALSVAGQPVDAAGDGPDMLVAVRDRKAIDVLAGGNVVKTITGELYSADQIVQSGNQTVVLDRLRTAVFAVDVPDGKVREGLRAGDGATNAVADSYGRVLVTDTRGGALLAFSTAPLLLRQLYPVPGGIYAIAYDNQRGLAWVTLTERNEVVGFDVRGGEPVEKYRFPTVRQPNSIAVDEQTSRVFVGSATGEGIQVIQP